MKVHQLMRMNIPKEFPNPKVPATSDVGCTGDIGAVCAPACLFFLFQTYIGLF